MCCEGKDSEGIIYLGRMNKINCISLNLVSFDI